MPEGEQNGRYDALGVCHGKSVWEGAFTLHYDKNSNSGRVRCPDRRTGGIKKC